MLNPLLKNSNLLVFCTLINADKRPQIKPICDIAIFKALAFPGSVTKSKYFSDLNKL